MPAKKTGYGRGRKPTLAQYLKHQDNARGFGLARDVKAGQAYETPYAVAHRNRRKYGQPQGPVGRQARRRRA